MTITVNSKQKEFVEGETLTTLMKRMNFMFPLVVVKLDGETVPSRLFPTTKIPDGAVVEIMHLISGG